MAAVDVDLAGCNIELVDDNVTGKIGTSGVGGVREYHFDAVGLMVGCGSNDSSRGNGFYHSIILKMKVYCC